MTRHSHTLACLFAAMLVTARVIAADDLLPAVDTSAPAPAPAQTTPAPAAKPAVMPSRATPPAAPGSAVTPAKPPARVDNASDRVELENTQITGNRELPKVMYVVPWKKPDLGDLAGRPAKSLLDELLEPVDRDVFRRQNRYFSALQPDATTSSGSADTPPAAAPARGGDEK